jgi:hypothetical protein
MTGRRLTSVSYQPVNEVVAPCITFVVDKIAISKPIKCMHVVDGNYPQLANPQQGVYVISNKVRGTVNSTPCFRTAMQSDRFARIIVALRGDALAVSRRSLTAAGCGVA